MDQTAEDRKMTCIGQAFLLLVIIAFIGGGLSLLWPDALRQLRGGGPDSAAAPAGGSGEPAAGKVEIGLAYGTEKERWLAGAVEEFAKTPEGRDVAVKLIPCGSREGAQKILEGDRSIQAWLPASDLYTEYFRNEWQVKHGGDPVAKSENLLLTPMVFVFWAERYQSFLTRYKAASFLTIGQALEEKEGWKGIAGQADWGFFKFGHTNPVKSNSGGVTLILMACDRAGKNRGLSMSDILDGNFRNWLTGFETAADASAASTGTMMREMVLKGPSAYDCVCVYENLAIDYLKNAEGRWGKLHVVYPARNLWNNNPFYILNLPWSSPEQRKALEKLLAFLMSERVQRQSLAHGFRPGNPAVAINGPESPFVKYQPYGLQIAVNPEVQVPAAEVVENLLQGWQRSIGAGR